MNCSTPSPGPTEYYRSHNTKVCDAKSLIYSTVFAYNDTLFLERKPATMAEFFDLETFPGRKGMRRAPNAILVADSLKGHAVQREEKPKRKPRRPRQRSAAGSD